jgi:chromate transporter
MVVAFVGFVGGWTKALFGPDSLALAGSLAPAWRPGSRSCRAFCSSSPAGPLIETTHGQLRFTAPLSGITAAVVGVIVNLAAFFAWHVFWPAGGRRARSPAASIRWRLQSAPPPRLRSFDTRQASSR